jgi:hypothetical protein
MLLLVNLFKASGKWYAGGLVNVSEQHAIYDLEFRQELVDNQDFVVDGAFDEFIVVITHTESYETEDTKNFYQHLYPIGTFKGFRRSNVKS